MSKFITIFEEVMDGIDLKLPEIKSKSVTSLGKRNSNDNSKVAGKYLKGFDNTSKSMVSQRDREAAEAKGQIKNTLNDASKSQVVVLSKAKFDDLLNQSGGRTMDLSDGKPKALNSKSTNYEASLMPDGRVKITKLSK